MMILKLLKYSFTIHTITGGLLESVYTCGCTSGIEATNPSSSSDMHLPLTVGYMVARTTPSYWTCTYFPQAGG